MVFQNPDNQIVATIVEDDVAFGAENIGLPSDEIRRRVDSAMAAAGVSELARRPPHLLSGGQKQRVAIAGVLAMKPGTIIMDEPTAMLDPAGREEVMKTASALNKSEGITIILITHFMEEAALAGRIIVMSEGRAVMEGTPAEVFGRPDEMRALGLDVPPAADIAGRLRALGISLPGGIMTISGLTKAVAALKAGNI
jgi:energy-coupling factor transport system ATP-binding protein